MTDDIKNDIYSLDDEVLSSVVGNDRLEMFNLSDLKKHDDDTLFRLLKESWGYKNNEPLVIFGIVKQVNGFGFYVLDDLRNINWESIVYPISDFYKISEVFVGSTLANECEVGDLIKVQVKLGPLLEREKHDNPLEVNAIVKTMQKLIKIPDEVWQKEINLQDGYIESWVVNYLSNMHADKIKQQTEELTKKTLERQKEIDELLQSTQVKFDSSESKFQKNIEIIKKQKELIKDDKKEIFKNKDLIRNIKLELELVKTTKGDIVNTLNKFIKNKAKLLHELDIVDEKTLIELTGVWENTEQELDCYSLKNDFESVKSAIDYIQAYLYNKGIMYRREVLENFFTLLTTRDLIILAGDSGSGKTNLVKSFAEAIGGKSFIIPVKPNWTGSEDLLGYYNPIEQSYLSTLFLDALLEAGKNPNTPYFICLDEMNLARVEYYFADFLSLLEERDQQPEIHLYSQSESSHLVSETKNFLALLDVAKENLGKESLNSFVEILQDEELNRKLHDLCGFKDGDSLLKYHTKLRKSFASYLNNPAILQIPNNVFFIGAINIDETTHYLSPKILDRAHIIRFTNPLLQDWDEIEEQIESHDMDLSKPVLFTMDIFGQKAAYPRFERSQELETKLTHITKTYLLPLGVEFGLRSIRQAKNYSINYEKYFNISSEEVYNNIVRQKILPKLMFDGMKKINQDKDKKDILIDFRNNLIVQLKGLTTHEQNSAINELNETLNNAEINDWIVNYWSI